MILFRFVIVILTLLAFYTTGAAGYTLSNMLPHKKRGQKFKVQAVHTYCYLRADASTATVSG